MQEQNSYNLPTIHLATREDLIEMLNRCEAQFVFIQIDEVVNPIGRQWDMVITSKIQKNDIGVALVHYQESFYEELQKVEYKFPDWLKQHCPTVQNIYSGRLSP